MAGKNGENVLLPVAGITPDLNFCHQAVRPDSRSRGNFNSHFLAVAQWRFGDCSVQLFQVPHRTFAKLRPTS